MISKQLEPKQVAKLLKERVLEDFSLEELLYFKTVLRESENPVYIDLLIDINREIRKRADK